MGVVSGIVMAFQFGTKLERAVQDVRPDPGSASDVRNIHRFHVEATFFGVLIFGRSRVPPGSILFSTAMVALGTTFSAFWIMVNNSWMQVPVGYVTENGAFVPDNWIKIIFNFVVWVRFPQHAARFYLTGAFCVCRDRGMVCAAARLSRRVSGHAAHGPGSRRRPHSQSSSSSDICAASMSTHISLPRWLRSRRAGNDEKPAVRGPHRLAGCREPAEPVRDHAAAALREPDRFRQPDLRGDRAQQHPPGKLAAGAHPRFFGFRIMVVCGVVMLGLAWLGSYLSLKHRLERKPFPALADILELPAALYRDRYGLVHGRSGPSALGGLRSFANRGRHDALLNDARSDDLARQSFCAVYAFIFSFGTFYVYRLIRTGPVGKLFESGRIAVPNRPLSLAEIPMVQHSRVGAGE